MSTKNIARYTVGFIIFFIVVYNENFLILGLKFSFIWKIIVMSYFAYYILKYQTKKTYSFIRYGYLLSIKQLLSVGAIVFIFDSLISTLKYAIFPLIADFFILFFKSVLSLKKILIYLCTYLILSGIPFYFNLLEPPNIDPIFLDEYGLEDAVAFAGIFQGSSPASACIAVVLLIMIFYIKQRKTDIVNFLHILIVLLGTYFLYLTYVRTGWLIFIFGVLYLSLDFKKLSSIIKTIFLVGIFSGGFFYLYTHNSAFYNRINDVKIQNNSEEQKSRGSGRGEMAMASLGIFADGNIEEKLFGFGDINFREKMDEYGFEGLFPHNGFINILVNSGIIGFVLFIFIFISLYLLMYRFKYCKHFKLFQVLFFSYIIFNLTQGGNNWYLDLLFSLTIALVIKENEEYKTLIKLKTN